jgi:hypothetical protein
MLFHDSKDESAWGLALVGFLAVVMAAFLGEMTGRVQPKAPVEITHPDVSSPDLREPVVTPNPHGSESSPYPQPSVPGK